jgi:hypothetical protein
MSPAPGLFLEVRLGPFDLGEVARAPGELTGEVVVPPGIPEGRVLFDIGRLGLCQQRLDLVLELGFAFQHPVVAHGLLA